ncbi:hypothetical protein [Modestobacter excelsi]|uniref:hypothetical protein n=1 Tax=Modestobacter excelsi TaxID=2213161 RepID=UPI00110CC233|nr:hypothetical protein [Modestobacter excelsi]
MSDWTLDRWFGMAGVIVGLLGIGVAIWTWRAGRDESVPRYRIATHRLIGPSDPTSPFSATDENLHLSYESMAVTEASKVYIVFWNAGKKMLDWEANALTEEPLAVELPQGSSILGEPRILKQTRPSIHFDAQKLDGCPNVARFTFTFLDRGDGALVEMLVGGPTREMTVTGAFKASKPLKSDGLLGLAPDMPFRERFLRELVGALTWGNGVATPVLIGILSLVSVGVFASTSLLAAVIALPVIAVFWICVMCLVIPALNAASPQTVAYGNGDSKKTPAPLKKLPSPLQRIPVPLPARSSSGGPLRRFIADVREDVVRARSRVR